jgi:hypothetical protein
MPGNLTQSEPNGVMPASLCTAFTELCEYAQLQNQFHDGTVQRSQLAKTSRRTFRLNKRLNASMLASLYAFWVSQNGGFTPFAFYNPFEVASGQQNPGKVGCRVPWQMDAGYRNRAVKFAGTGIGGGGIESPVATLEWAIGPAQPTSMCQRFRPISWTVTDTSER